MDNYVVAIFVGILFLIIGLFFLRDRIKFIKTGIETCATVIWIKVSISNDPETINNVSYIPHFSFFTHDKKEIQFVYGSSGTSGKWSIGDTIKVVYNDAYPNDFVIRTFWGSYGNSIFLLSAGFIPFIVGCLHFLIKYLFAPFS